MVSPHVLSNRAAQGPHEHQSVGPFKDSDPELAQYYICSILLVKTSHRSSPVKVDKQGYECKECGSAGTVFGSCSRYNKTTAAVCSFLHRQKIRQ